MSVDEILNTNENNISNIVRNLSKKNREHTHTKSPLDYPRHETIIEDPDSPYKGWHESQNPNNKEYFPFITQGC